MLRLFLSAILAAALTGCALCDTYCEGPSKGWHKYGDNCYMIRMSTEEKFSFYDAEDFCRSNGAHLVSILSQDENQFIADTIKSHSYYRDRMWIGLNELRGEKEYEWNDGQPFSYHNIVARQLYRKEKCFTISGKNGEWRSEHCSLQFSPICKRAASDAEPSPLPPLEPEIPKGNCPSDWLQFGGKCYKYFGALEAGRMKYGEAQKACLDIVSDQTGDLVSIHSMEEQAFLTRMLFEFGTSAWIGFRYIDNDVIGHDIIFGWTDNSRTNFTYWANGHPPRGTWKYCTYLNDEGYGKGQWMADTCDLKKRGFICQRSPDVSLPEPTKKTSQCGENYYEYKNACYRVYSAAATWDEAEKNCRKRGGHLMSINDAFEANFLYSQFFDGKPKAYWTGLRNVKYTRIFKWSDGSPLYYSDWEQNQPEASVVESSCVATSSRNVLEWKVEKCDVELPFICEVTRESRPPSPADVIGDCPSSESSWIDIGDKYCYHEGLQGSSKNMQWGDHSRYCMSKGLEMITLKTEHQMKSLFSYLWKRNKNYWLGLIRSFDKENFMWTDGSSLDYTNWAENEPSAWSRNYKKDCVAVSMSDLRWYPMVCSDWSGYLCRAKKSVRDGSAARVARSDRSYEKFNAKAANVAVKTGGQRTGSSGLVPLLVATIVCLGLSVFVAAMIFAWKRRNEGEFPTVLPVTTSEASPKENSDQQQRY